MSEADASDHLTWQEMLERTAVATKDRPAARWLCEEASGCDGAEFTAILQEMVSARSGFRLEQMLRRYLGGEPIQYVLGRWAFRRLDLKVDERVLIPRPETEMLVDLVKTFVARRSTPVRIVDLGTGSGAIGLSLLSELPIDSAQVWMTDHSSDAIDVASANAAGIGRPAGGARFAVGSWYEALDPSLKGTFDVIVSNPPYVSDDDPELDGSVRQWEPHSALFAGVDGLAAMRVIVAGAVEWLAPGGMLAVEMGHTQADAVNELFRQTSFSDVTVHKDAFGRDRCVTGVTTA
jgi:release factor glutamine methyltransferase